MSPTPPNAGLTSSKHDALQGTLGASQLKTDGLDVGLHALKTPEPTVSRLISVSPSDAGWVLEAEHPPLVQLFPSGGVAEAAARALARRTADEGHDAELHIYLKGGALAGVVNFPAQFRVKATA